MRPVPLGRLARSCARSPYTSTASGRSPAQSAAISFGVPGCRRRNLPRMALSTPLKARLRRSPLAPAHSPYAPAPVIVKSRRLALSLCRLATLGDFAPSHARALPRPPRTASGSFAMLASRVVAASFRLSRMVRSLASSSPVQNRLPATGSNHFGQSGSPFPVTRSTFPSRKDKKFHSRTQTPTRNSNSILQLPLPLHADMVLYARLQAMAIGR